MDGWMDIVGFKLLTSNELGHDRKPDWFRNLSRVSEKPHEIPGSG
jgi:hypothetical protein